MTKEDIFQVIKSTVMNILPEVTPPMITPEKSLVELGANSVDRVEIAIYSMEALKLKIPTAELHGLRNLAGLVDVFHRHLSPH